MTGHELTLVVRSSITAIPSLLTLTHAIISSCEHYANVFASVYMAFSPFVTFNCNNQLETVRRVIAKLAAVPNYPDETSVIAYCQ